MESKTVTINIPRNALFTSYAEGLFLSKEINPDGSVDIILDGKSCVILYFHFRKHRRVYICCQPDKVYGESVLKFKNSEANFGILTSLTGRAFDRFKRTMNIISYKTKGRCYSYPLSFFCDLSVMCMTGHNCEVNITRLINLYDSLNTISVNATLR